MIKHSKQSGSTHVIIIVILIVALLGTLGFVFWKNYINQEGPKDVAHNDSPTKVETKKTPYDGWLSYSLKREKFNFKYPASWALTDRSATAGECMPNAQNCPDRSYDYASLVSPTGLEMGISAGLDGSSARLKGQGCPAAKDVCTQYEGNPVTINSKRVYMVVTGYKQYNVAENFTLGLTQQKDCILYCDDGLGSAHILLGDIHVSATYPDRNTATYEEFSSDKSVKEAKLIAESLSY